MRRIVPASILATAFTAAILLAGCAPATPGGSDSNGAVGGYQITALTADEVAELQGSGAEMAPMVFPESNQVFSVLLFGSSSCPPEPVGVVSVTGGLELDLKAYPGMACTADFAPAGYRITSTANFDWTTMTVATCTTDGGARACTPIDVQRDYVRD